jgi:hypothetical protein
MVSGVGPSTIYTTHLQIQIFKGYFVYVSSLSVCELQTCLWGGGGGDGRALILR